MRYADPDTVFHLLEIDPDSVEPEIVAERARVEALELAVAAAIDFKCNRTFGVAPLEEERTLSYSPNSVIYYWDRVLIPGSSLVFFGDFYSGDPNDPYLSPTGFQNITQIMTGGTWDGTVWDDEEELAVDLWQYTFRREDGWYMGISIPTRRYSSIRVTAEWESGSTSETVPDDIREAANFILVDEARIRMQSPMGEIGPAGLSTFLRNAWEYEMVKTAIRNNTFRQLIV